MVLVPGLFLALGQMNPVDGKGQKSTQIKDNGIGPIKSVTVGKTLDKKMVAEGQVIFYSKCSKCHALNSTKAAPPLAGVTKMLSPAFIMNYLLNTTQMQQKDQYVKQLMQYYQSFPKMPPQNLSEGQARAILEFLRSTAK